MTDKKLLEVFGFYRQWATHQTLLEPERKDPEDFDMWAFEDGELKAGPLCHIKYMCDKASGFVQEGRRDKAFRWLGFIQGVLVATGQFSLNDVGGHSMPNPDLGE